MKFIDFKKKLNKFKVLSIMDIRKIESNFDLRRLSEWTKKGYLEKVRRGYYIFSDSNKNEQFLFNIANKIYNPSYVSLETAFSVYGIIPESVYSIVSVTTQKTNCFKANIATFDYRHLQARLFFGYHLKKHDGCNYLIADLEKSILDYFYLNPKISSKEDFDGLRFNTHEIKNNIDIKKFEKYLKTFNNKSLTSRIDKFLIYIKNA